MSEVFCKIEGGDMTDGSGLMFGPLTVRGFTETFILDLIFFFEHGYISNPTAINKFTVPKSWYT